MWILPIGDALASIFDAASQHLIGCGTNQAEGPDGRQRAVLPK